MKLGHQAPKGYVVNRFDIIRIANKSMWVFTNDINISNKNIGYCSSHGFYYDKDVEEKKLYSGIPCLFTDNRFILENEDVIFIKNNMSLKACIRRCNKLKGLPFGTYIEFKRNGHFLNKPDLNLSYLFKVRKENKVSYVYNIDKEGYVDNFTDCDFSKELTNKLRANGFIVRVFINENIAIAYGHGKIIGYSSHNNHLRGYYLGCDNILWDKYEEFDKWSKCETIPKTTPIDEIIKQLTNG